MVTRISPVELVQSQLKVYHNFCETLDLRRLQNLVHALGTQGAFHQVSNGYGADKSRETSILALFFSDVLGKNLGRILRLQNVSDRAELIPRILFIPW